MSQRAHFERTQVKKVDWGSFWIFETLSLSLPIFMAVFTLPRDSRLESHQLLHLASVQLGLTVLSAVLAVSRRSERTSNRERERHAK
jgi:hypothetical protein